MKLIPINERAEENENFRGIPHLTQILQMTIDFYQKVGFIKPWIGYFAEENGEFVGSAGFKGKPVNGMIEIAYGTFELYQHRGFGKEICSLLVQLSIASDPSLKITARTLPEENFSTRILQKNDFILSGTVNDPEDGDVWEWIYKPDHDS